jgi:glycine cleavage system regulatory protein
MRTELATPWCRTGSAWQNPTMATLVLTVIGDDRTGLVGALAGPITRHGGNWDRSHMARLAGKFAGIVVVTVADVQVDALAAELGRLRAEGLLDVTIAIASADTAPTHERLLQLHLIGQDRPGIISEIAAALAERNVSVEEIETSAASAPMSGEVLFEATATLRMPSDLDPADLRSTLESIANELMVDLDVTDHRRTNEGR